MLQLTLHSGEISLQAATAKGKFPFTATVTYGGQASDHFVGGTESVDGGPYRVIIPTELLRRKIADLEGRSVFANDDLRSHNGEVVGEFVSAWVETTEVGGKLVVAAKASGILDREKNPELVDKILAEAREGKLGFSYDLKEVKYEITGADEEHPEPHLRLTGFKWRGATILRREAAAYEETLLAANKTQNRGTAQMDEKQTLDAIAKALAPVTDGLGKLAETVKGITEKQTAMEAQIGKPAPSKEPDKPAAGSQPTTVTALAAAIAEEVGKIIKPLADGVAALQSSSSQKKGERRSYTVAELEGQLISKYDSSRKPEDPVTLGDYDKAIAAVQADATLSRDAKTAKLETLGAAKLMAWKSQRASGGVN